MRCWAEIEASGDVKPELRLVVDHPAFDPHHQLRVGTVGYRDPCGRRGVSHDNTTTLVPREDGDIIITSSDFRGAIPVDTNVNIDAVSQQVNSSDTNFTDEVEFRINGADGVESIDRCAVIRHEVKGRSGLSVNLVAESNFALFEVVAVWGEGERYDEERISGHSIIHKHISRCKT